jgi:hypothetical protein
MVKIQADGERLASIATPGSHRHIARQSLTRSVIADA